MERRVVRPTVAMLLGVLLVGTTGVLPGSGQPVAQTATTPRFEPAPCPPPRDPVPGVETWRCGDLVVPENRATPAGRTIRLPVAIVPAATPTPASEPVVFLSGGPGEDAIQEAQDVIDAGLNRDRELILISQRGTYFAQPAVTCPEIDVFHARHVAFVSDASATKACHDRLAATGADLHAYNTRENAADIADLRRALGIDQWNVYGQSYGSYLALTYMREYPDGIRAVTLDSVVPPDVAAPSWFWTTAKEAFGNVFQACGEDAACREQYPNLAATFTGLVRQLESSPVETSTTLPGSDNSMKVVLNGGALVNWMMWMVSHAENATEVPYGIDQLARGHPEVIAQQWASSWAAPDFQGQYAYGLHFGVACAEWVPYEAPSQVLERGRAEFPEFPDSVLVQPPNFSFITDDCHVWNVPQAPGSVRTVTHSAIPTLIVEGAFDAKTGSQWGYYVARQLTHSTVITIPGVGHAAVFVSECAQNVVASFFRTPDLPDTSCVATLSAKPFKLS